MADKPFPAYEGDAPYFFVSYAHEDAELVYPEMTWIKKAGFNLWYDDGIHVGSVWRQALADALSGSVAMVFFATARSTESNNCLKELNFILDEDKPVFVVQLDDTPLPSLLRLSLSDRQALVRSEFDDDTYHSRLVSALSTVVAPAVQSASVEAPSAGTTTIKTDPPSIVVMPPTYLGDEQEMAYLRDGIAGDLIARLAHRSWHIVAGQPEDTTLEPQQIGTQRGVRYILGGTLQRGGDRVRLTAHLTDAAIGQELWGQRYERTAEDLLVLQDRLVNSIDHDLFGAILRIERRRLRGVPDAELDAWGLCARSSMRVVDLATRDRVLSLLEQAVTRDPRFAYAHSLYGFQLATMIYTQFTRRVDEFGKLALQHAEHALSLASNNVVVLNHASLVHRIVGDPESALRLAERAAEITGRSSQILVAALILAGRFDEALEIGNAEPELMISTDMVAANLALGRFDQAYEWARRGTTLEPRDFLNWVFFASVQAHLEQPDNARASLDRAREIVPGFTLASFSQGIRVAWRRDDLVAAIEAGLLRLGAA